jgi:hypothetical protein
MMDGQKMSENGETPNTSSTQRAQRNREISRVRLGGASWRSIAQEFGVSERTERRAFEEHLGGAGEHYFAHPLLVVMEAVAIYTDTIDRLAALAENADSTAAAVGALRSRVSTARELVDLLSRVGAIPPGSGEWTTHAELEMIADVLIAMARKRGIVAELIEHLKRQPPPLAALAQAIQNRGSR